MVEPTPSTDVEARFKALAGRLPQADWDKLVSVTAERMLRRLAATGMMDAATPQQLAEALALLGHALVDYTNVALTALAEGEEADA